MHKIIYFNMKARCKACCESVVECQCNFWFESLSYLRTARQFSVFRLFPKVSVSGLTSFYHGRAIRVSARVRARVMVSVI